MDLINKKRLLLPLPLFIGNIIANVTQLMPKPLLTTDQLKLLKYDNIYSNKYKNNLSLNMPSKKIFREEVKKYCYMWKEGGQFSTDRYNFKIK